ncbi:MAG: dihydrofolate reductase family protein [Gaiellaceae bacterium]
MSSDLRIGQEETREREDVMRRVILETGISIDGYVAALDKSHPWGVEGEDEGIKRWVLDSVWAAGAHLMGRVTYEEMAAFCPTSTSEYARPMNEIPKVVFSKTLEQADWSETRIVRGDLSEEIGRLKREPGNDLIAYGGATFDQALSRLGLVDEYRLMIQPAALGADSPCSRICPLRCTSSSLKRRHMRRASPFTSTVRVPVPPGSSFTEHRSSPRAHGARR